MCWLVFTVLWLSNAAVLHSLNYGSKKDSDDYISLYHYLLFPIHLIQLAIIVNHCRKQKTSYFKELGNGIGSFFN